jgi:hypothetical protein
MSTRASRIAVTGDTRRSKSRSPGRSPTAAASVRRRSRTPGRRAPRAVVEENNGYNATDNVQYQPYATSFGISNEISKLTSQNIIKRPNSNYLKALFEMQSEHIPGLRLNFNPIIFGPSSPEYPLCYDTGATGNQIINFNQLSTNIIEFILASPYAEPGGHPPIMSVKNDTTQGYKDIIIGNLDTLLQTYYDGLGVNSQPPSTEEFRPLFGELMQAHLKTDLRTVFERLKASQQATQLSRFLDEATLCFLCGGPLSKKQLEHIESVIDALFGIIGIIQFLSRGDDAYVTKLPMILLLLFLIEYAYACDICNNNKSNYRIVTYHIPTKRWRHDKNVQASLIKKLQKDENNVTIIPAISRKQFGAMVYVKNRVMDYLQVRTAGTPLDHALVYHVMSMCNFFRKITEAGIVMLFTNVLLRHGRVPVPEISYPDPFTPYLPAAASPAAAAAASSAHGGSYRKSTSKKRDYHDVTLDEIEMFVSYLGDNTKIPEEDGLTQPIRGILDNLVKNIIRAMHIPSISKVKTLSVRLHTSPSSKKIVGKLYRKPAIRHNTKSVATKSVATRRKRAPATTRRTTHKHRAHRTTHKHSAAHHNTSLIPA